MESFLGETRVHLKELQLHIKITHLYRKILDCSNISIYLVFVSQFVLMLVGISCWVVYK